MFCLRRLCRSPHRERGLKPPLNEALRVTSRLVDYIRAGRILDEAEKVLTPIEVTIVEKRYRLGMKWETVAKSVGYCFRDVLRKHREILKKIANI